MQLAAMPDSNVTRELLRTYTAGTGARCPRCRYDLRGLTKGRCPECGTRVDDILKLASIGGGRFRIVYFADVRQRIILYTGPTLACALAAGFWLAVHLSGAPRFIAFAVTFAMILFALAAAEAWRHLARRLWRRKDAGAKLLRTFICWAPAIALTAVVIALGL